MPRKAKFNPEITRVKLNPEQAVLQCDCFNVDKKGPEDPQGHGAVVCITGTRIIGNSTASAGSISST